MSQQSSNDFYDDNSEVEPTPCGQLNCANDTEAGSDLCASCDFGLFGDWWELYDTVSADEYYSADFDDYDYEADFTVAYEIGRAIEEALEDVIDQMQWQISNDWRDSPEAAARLGEGYIRNRAGLELLKARETWNGEGETDWVMDICCEYQVDHPLFALAHEAWINAEYANCDYRAERRNRAHH